MYLGWELDKIRRAKRKVWETDTRQETWGEGHSPRKDTSDTISRVFPQFSAWRVSLLVLEGERDA